MNEKLTLSLFCAAIATAGSAAFAQSSLVDPTFDPGTGPTNGIVETVLPQPDGKVLVCGNFTAFNGVSQGYIARLNNDGSVDPSFHAGPGYWVRHMALQSDGKIVVGGFFTNVEGQPRNRVARLNSDGSLDSSFDPGLGAEKKIVEGDPTDPFVFAVAVQPDGRIVIAGNFLTYNGVPRRGIARLNSDGSLDTSFNIGAGFDSWGRFLLLLPNDQILATGWMTHYDNQLFNRMVRLNSDGTAEKSFNPFFGDKTAVYGAVLLPNGQFIVGGHSVNDQGLFHREFERLNQDGSVDTNYAANANEKVESIYLQPDGKIIIGGYFSFVNGTSRNGLARINPDGSLDDNFQADTDNFVWTVRGQADGKVLVCGGFTTVGGVSRPGVARLLTGVSGNTGDGGGSGGSGSSGDGSGTPIPPQLLQPAMDHGQFSVVVPTVAGSQYVLQSRDLDSDRWLSLPAVLGDGTNMKLLDPGTASSSGRIYRVRVN